MDDRGFRDFLEGEGLTDKAINSRLTRANRVEREFNVNLDVVIQSEQNMIEVRQKIYESYGDKGSTPGNLYNAVAKYYKFKNGIEMPRITQLQR
ncbi:MULTISPECIES: hypothetical protein [Clostridium]|uniref:Uncharacterized protein n=2 Tax=Clostridium TaxID=1485 RepID=A0AAC9RS80_9CLOT|nr:MULTISPECIES: hypothetical protein [Clostridium]AOY75373.1 hypothetical protein BJL90_05340 [Clostridium formicaceticum]ARE89828.1 hypothetical protein CLFO_43110 [Clostridium formicaceticum]MBD8045753.1 hypothetical protein [Clostridium faecium]